MSQKNIIFEKILIEKLKSGDHDAFSVVFSAYYKDLVMFAFSFTKEVASSEEIVQETFVKLWVDHEILDVKISLKSILLKSIQNRCIDLLRHKKIMSNHCSYIINNSPIFVHDTDKYILRSELEESINRAINKLPEKAKEAFVMNRYKGFKYHEIASELNVSVRTVEVRISKALELLRKELKDFY